MHTFTVHPNDETQEKALKAVFEALKVEYEEDFYVDETERILSNPYLTKKLKDGREDMESGKGVSIQTEDLWK